MAKPLDPPEMMEDLPPELPAQGIGPHFEINAEGKIDLAPPEALDRDGNYLPTLRSLHPELREMATALARRLPKGNNTHALLGDRIAAYAALIDQDLAGVDFRPLYMAGMRLRNGLGATDTAIAAGDAPPLNAEAREEIDSLLEGHGPFIMASRAGAEAVAAAVAYRRQPEEEREYRVAAVEFAGALAANPEVITEAAAKTVKDAAAGIGEGVQPERGTVAGQSVIGNVTITLVTGVALASLPVIGTAIAGPISIPAIAGVLLTWAGFKILERSDAGQATLDAGKLRFDDLAKRAPEVMRKLRQRLAALPAFLKSVRPQLRHFSSIGPEYGWIERSIVWLEKHSISPPPPGLVIHPEPASARASASGPNVVIGPPPEFSQAAAEKMIRDGQAPPEAWRPFIKQLAFGSAEWLADRELQTSYKVGPPNEPINLDLLTGLDQLERLALVSMPLMSIEPLAALESLYWLELAETSLRNIGPISHLLKLNRLNLSRTPVSDLTPLAGLPALEMLYLDNTNVEELAPLALIGKQGVIDEATVGSAIGQPLRTFGFVPSLRELSLKATLITDFAPLSSLAGLRGLYLNGTPVSDLAPLSGLAGLRDLHLNDTPVSDLAPLNGLAGLRTLVLTGTPVSDLAPLSGIAGLQWLALSGTQVSDLAPLSGLAGLQKLGLSDNAQVRDLAPLSGLTGLRELYLSGTQVSDLAPLSGLTGLRELYLINTQVSAGEVVAFEAARGRLGLGAVEIYR